MRTCPACETVVMMTFSDSAVRLEIDSCPECYGLWFDSEELKLFFESSALSARILDDDLSAAPPQAEAEAAPTTPAQRSQRCCPACGEQMFDSRLGQTSIDYCLSCRGIWLDRHELEQLVTAYQAGERGNLLIVNQLIEGLGTPLRPNPRAADFLEALSRYRQTLRTLSEHLPKLNLSS